jgi:hypothetical protein
MPTPENSAQWRRLENGHILLWLLKDTCWVMEWKIGGVVMILPTLAMAIFIFWKLRHSASEAFHNAAVCCWIAANSLWMTGEFFEWPLRPYAAVLFFIGLLILVVYYVAHFRKKVWARPVP